VDPIEQRREHDAQVFEPAIVQDGHPHFPGRRDVDCAVVDEQAAVSWDADAFSSNAVDARIRFRDPRAVPTLWVNRLPGRSKEHPDEWVKALASLDKRLRLHRQPPKGLLDHEEFLYLATDGLMEHLIPLVGMAARLAILEGNEAITSDILKEAASYLDILHPADGSDTPEDD
jgi:hypothetical protein